MVALKSFVLKWLRPWSVYFHAKHSLFGKDPTFYLKVAATVLTILFPADDVIPVAGQIDDPAAATGWIAFIGYIWWAYTRGKKILRESRA